MAEEVRDRTNVLLACLLCASSDINLFYEQTTGVNWRVYGRREDSYQGLRFFRCRQCELVFKEPVCFPVQEAERAHYQNHQNFSSDVRYRNYLKTLLLPLQSHLSASAIGLDFGCGPELVLSQICRDFGWECESYDPYFYPERSALEKTYDFVVCSEVFEHFHYPREEIIRLVGILNPNGWMVVRTETPPIDFEKWYYHRDPTHVVFYSEATFRWMAKKWGLYFEALERNLFLFQKIKP